MHTTGCWRKRFEYSSSILNVSRAEIKMFVKHTPTNETPSIYLQIKSSFIYIAVLHITDLPPGALDLYDKVTLCPWKMYPNYSIYTAAKVCVTPSTSDEQNQTCCTVHVQLSLLTLALWRRFCSSEMLSESLYLRVMLRQTSALTWAELLILNCA